MPVNQRPRTLNLMQLRRNKRKRADKTSGRKQPGFRDVDVEGADDADDDVASQLVARVTGDDPSGSQPAAATAVDIDQSICHACDLPEPPARKNKRVNIDTISLVGCNFCPRWYHRVCVGKVKDTGRNPFRCDLCADN